MYSKIISDLVRQNKRTEVLQMLSQTPEYLSYAGYYQDEENFLLDLIKRNPKAMQFIKEDLLDSADFINKATHRYTWAAKYASSRLKDDPEFIEDSFERGSRANNATIKCASPQLLDDMEFVRRMAIVHISIIESTSPRLKYDQKFNLELVKRNNLVFPHIARQFRENKKFVLEAISYGVEDISKIGKNLLNDKDFLLRAVQAGLTCLPDGIDDVLTEDEDFIRQLIRSGLRTIPSAYPIKTKEFLEYLVSNNISYDYSGIEPDLFHCSEVLELLVNTLSYQTLTGLSDKDFLLPSRGYVSYDAYQYRRMHKINYADMDALQHIVDIYTQNIQEYEAEEKLIAELAIELRQYAAARKTKIDELNITYLSRLGDWAPYLVEQRLRLANKQLDPNKPVIVIWQGKKDHNGGLEVFKKFYSELDRKNQILFFEIDSLQDIDQALLLLQTHLPKTIEQRALIINAHGSQGRIDFGQEYLTPNLLEDVYGEILTKLNINTLVLDSCSTGLGKDNKPNLANVFGRYIKTVFAPTINTSLSEMKLDSTGKIIDVVYRGNVVYRGDFFQEYQDILIIDNPVYKINSSEDIPYYGDEDFLNLQPY
ncbi:MAG: DUF4116 domain-containing protein [Candidatus Margulisbacteria bacterium]|jgi:hypothetical protein|nr:DUF4116 domain-containing protein [Candidatus Margulisiibacteriota bacterium]